MNPSAGSFNAIAHLMMLGWFPICFGLFLWMKPAKAVAVGIVAGLLLLPNIEYEFHRLPDYDKTMAISFGLIVAALVFDRARLFSFRPRWIDLPVLLICTVPLCSVLANGLGVWGGLAGGFGYLVRWGFPWILGRVYLADFKPQHQLALAIIIGALIYAPFCLLEAKISPMLHPIVYGVQMRGIEHASRGLLWRPNVFIEHGLKCALFLGMAAFLAYALWASKARTRLFGLPMIAVVGILMVTTAAASSKMALLMMGVGIVCLGVANRARLALPVLLLILVPPSYIGLRQGVGWGGEELLVVAETVFGKVRGGSLLTRLESEDLLAPRASERIWFGWADMGEFTGNRLRSGGSAHEAFTISVDSMWLIYIGTNGVIGVIAVFAIMLMAPFLVWRNLPPKYWSHPAITITVALGIMSVLFAIDSLMNSFDNPIYIAAAGGVSGLLGTREGQLLWK
jgi:hypothetical protein